MKRKYTSLPYIERPVANGNFASTGRLPIKRIVIHTADGYLNGTLAWFNNPKSKVSSNYIIHTNGQIYAMLEEYYVPFTNGNLTSNRESITIEMIDDREPDAQKTNQAYKSVSELVFDICKYYNLPINRTTVKGHNEVSSSHPFCPGNTDLDRIVREAQPKPVLTDAQKLAKITEILFSNTDAETKVNKAKAVLA